MKRRTFLNGLTAAATLALASTAAFAATFADGVVTQLTKQGFSNIAVDTTWLGRVRIIGNRQDGQREIILNPRTGEILRDTWRAAGNAAATPIIDDIDDRSSSSDDNSGSGDDGNGGDSGSDGSGSGGSDGSGSDGGGSGGSGSGGSGGDDSGGGSGHSGGGHGGDDGNDDGDGGGKDK